jgi:hypothetical protein
MIPTDGACELFDSGPNFSRFGLRSACDALKRRLVYWVARRVAGKDGHALRSQISCLAYFWPFNALLGSCREVRAQCQRSFEVLNDCVPQHYRSHFLKSANDKLPQAAIPCVSVG